jgi:hypothetical protein
MTNANASGDPSHISRRAFAERLALAAAAPFILGDFVPETLAAETAAPPQQPQTPEPSALAKTLAEGVRLRWPDRFSPDDVTALARAIDGRLRGAERLYQTPLTNGDEPDFVYSVYRGAD